jgi:hypothetical protein
VSRLVHAVVLAGTLTVTITKNMPSPADDTPEATRRIRHRFIRITNDGNICKISDG